MTKDSISVRKLLSWLLTKLSEEEISVSVLDFLSDKYKSIAKDKSLPRALAICTVHFSIIFISLISEKFKWSIVMFRNYFKITFRTLMRNKGYSFINIFGLTTGIACCIFIYLYVDHETSYDSYHRDVERVYRFTASMKTSAGTSNYAGISHQITPFINENLQERAISARVMPTALEDCRVKYGEKMFREAGYEVPIADKEIFRIMTFDFIQGDPDNALERPYTAVITESIAEKYFGDEDSVGKVMTIDDSDYEITAVIKDIPGNTVLQFKIMRTWTGIDSRRFYPHWLGNFHRTFLKLMPGEYPDDFEKLVTQTILDNSAQRIADTGIEYEAFLQPIGRVHLYSAELIFERDIIGNITYVYVFSGIGIFILLIASINFVNLVTARSSKRACEVGVRKVAGARINQLISQFMGESLLITAISFIFAVIIVFLFLDKFNELTLLNIKYSTLASPKNILIILTAVVIIGLSAGSYPAFLLSSYKPVSVLKGTLSTGVKGQKLRKVLVVGQYTLSIAMIIGVILFDNQLEYMKNTPLGFDKERKLIIDMQGTGAGRHNYVSVKEEFTGHSSVMGASFSTAVPGRSIRHIKGYPTGQQKTNAHDMNFLEADGDLLSLYGLELIAGKNLSDEERTNLDYMPFILNETAVKIFGWNRPEDVINKKFRDEPPYGIAIGVVRDFHFAGLQKAIEPFVITLRGGFRYLTLKIDTGNINETIAFTEEKFKTLFPNAVFDYFFLDDDFNRLYQREEQTAKIFGIFTFLGIIIAALGLLGLAAFVSEQRTKEIGIRKVMGASTENIVRLLSSEFVYLVLASNLIACPLGYYLMNKWLQNFAYRIDIGITVFFIAGSIAVVIAFASVSYQSLKAAVRSPVDSMRYE
ncbi:ABC transporter permease [candidate division KSB1 bacterium]